MKATVRQSSQVQTKSLGTMLIWNPASSSCSNLTIKRKKRREKTKIIS